MKIRHGFVSNSSSTSFTCDVCGSEDNHGSGMFECENGHVVCYNHEISLTDKEKKTVLKKLWNEIDLKEDLEDDWSQIDTGEYPVECCPICQFVSANTVELYNWLLIRQGIDSDYIVSDIKSQFNNDYKSFQEFLKENLKKD